MIVLNYYLLDTSEFGKGIQSDLDLHVTKGRLNKASFRQKLDTIVKNVIRNDNFNGGDESPPPPPPPNFPSSPPQFPRNIL